MVMSSPPEYQSLSQHDPDESFSGGTSKPLYPPAVASPAPGESSALAGDDGELITITYTFIPRYPVSGDKQNALGVLYPDKLKTAAALRRIFLTLQEYELDRIEILAPVEIDGDTKWGVVMDEAWPRMVSENPPKRLKVQIADGPGDARRRSRRELGICGSTVGGIGIFSLIMFGIVLIVKDLKGK